ncbi:winged helix-turn-helix transcriptional regulator [Syntrophomonas erecta subsp. sporosyntropha]
MKSTRLHYLLVSTDLNYREIGQRLGRSGRAVSRRIRRLNEREQVV